MEESSSVSNSTNTVNNTANNTTNNTANNTTNNTANNTTNVSKSTKDSMTSYLTNYSTRTFSNSTRTLSNEEIESRRSGFEKFITSLPKVCSPTICGLLNYRTPNSKLFSSVYSSSNHESSNQISSLNHVNNNKSNNDKSNNKSEDTSGYQTSSCKVNNSTKSNCDKVIDSTSCKSTQNEDCKIEFKSTLEEKIKFKLNNDKFKDENVIEEENENNEFDWSIDQIALLNPCDITFDDNFLIYKEFEEDNKSLIIKQSEEFFKQNVIAPSPVVNTPTLARKRQLIHNICKTSSPFIDYLNSKQNNTNVATMFKTPLQLSDIKEASGCSNMPDDNLSFKTPHHHTPVNNEKQSIKLDEKTLPKKKLFHKFDTSSCSSKKATYLHSIDSLNIVNKNKHYSDISPALSDISQINNRFNCTELDLDCKNFSLDISEIDNGTNLCDSSSDHHNHIKSSTNRKESNRLFKDDCLHCLLEEDENEIKQLDLNDTNELSEDDMNDEFDEKNEINENEINRKDELNKDETKDIVEQINNEDDVNMSTSMNISIKPHIINGNCSLMDFSFETNEINDNQLLNEPTEQSKLNDQVSFMETSSIQCSLDNFNKIDPVSKTLSHKNQHLTSTPFRFS